MPDYKNLDQVIYIRLTTTRTPIKRAFAGTGQSRRREKSSAHWIAQSIVQGVRNNHRIERDGVAVDEAEIIDMLAEELWSVPETVAKALVGIDANKKDDAKRTITSMLLLAMTERYECTFFMPKYQGMGPSTYGSGH